MKSFETQLLRLWEGKGEHFRVEAIKSLNERENGRKIMSLGIESLRNSRIIFLYFVYIHLISVYVTCIFYNISAVCVCVCAQRVKRGKKPG